ncbi:MAG: hypothetical protein ABIH74_05745 [Candidatus Omnitrophota bacterium]
MKIHSPKKRSGYRPAFTLVEVVLASGIMAMVLVALIVAVVRCVTFTGQADKVYTASILAQRQIDVLGKFPFSDLTVIAPETKTSVDTDGDGITDYYRTTEIFEDYSGYADLLRIKVSVDRIEEGVESGHPVTMEAVFFNASE